ncbi:MAG TPA: hypothetical protein VGH36_03810 [Acetobacteraceae bacterium]|jgi:hypothetical protein
MRPRILLLSLSDWFGPTWLPHALQKAGFEVGLLGEPAGLLAQSSFIDYRFPLSIRHVRLGLLKNIMRVMTDFEPRPVLPCEEAAAVLLQNMATGWAGLHGGGLGCAGRCGSCRSRCRRPFASCCCAHWAMRAASRCGPTARRRAKLVEAMGVPSPPSMTVPYGQAAMRFADEHGWPVVLTRDERAGGVGAVMCRTREELHAAYATFTAEMDARPGLKTRLAQALWTVLTLYHLPGDLTVLPQDGPALSIEALVPGRMASHCVVAFEGRALGGLSAVAEVVHPEPLGTSTVVRLVQDAEMAGIARRLVARGGFTGFAGLDFVRDEANGKLWFRKFTPRPTPLAHLGHLAGGFVHGAAGRGDGGASGAAAGDEGDDGGAVSAGLDARPGCGGRGGGALGCAGG